ncbi:glycosyltransferase family 2 protein [Haloplasma contractile]|uniref:Glycosyl transferase family protein n=1 Tax=Haloplasma contractile SSD-17B TaxID=1033810 RepID=F7PU06_9MOLU|nr:glycosyltransferase family 2 protein [Haloplasma contractile]ERJ12256.1 Glycosyl transferase family protein [Haloplasma contractile SSD-17B]
MKLITFAVPSYNSEAYLHKCLDSLLIGGEDIEIIIVNDGSTDTTSKIADDYQKQYPSIVKVIHKENGGHGSAVNAGQDAATGMYFKVVDSDDWVNQRALKILLRTIKEHTLNGNIVDLYINNFIYDKIDTFESYTRNFRKNFPVDQICTWKDVKPFYMSSVLLMHSLIYRTEVLKTSNTQLPEHTFYVDNIFAYKPLPYTNTIFYIDIDLYHYYIGRSDQSVNINNIVKRYEQQIRVMKSMIDAYTFDEINEMHTGLRKYMKHCLSAIMATTIMFTTAKESEERRQNLEQLWDYIRRNDLKMYRMLRHRSISSPLNYVPWKLRGKLMISGYKYLRKKIKLG